MPEFYLDHPSLMVQCLEAQLSVGVWTYNTQTRTFALSPLVERLYGNTGTSVANYRDTQSRIHPDDRDQVADALETAFASVEPISVEHRLQHPDGKEYWLRVTAEPLSDHPGAWLGFVQDISHLAASREALSQSRELLSMAGHMAHFGGWRMEVDPQRLIWSPETARILEEPEGFQPTLERALGYFLAEDQSRLRQALQRCLEHGEPYDLQLQLITARGNRLWTRTLGQAERDDNGAIVALNGSFQDITEQVRNQQRADALAGQLENTLEHISDAFFTLDTDWRFTFINSRAEEMLEFRRDELLGRNIWEAFPEAVGSNFQRHYTHTLATGETSRFIAWYGDSLQKWFEASAYRVPEGLAIYFRDVTAEHDREQALRTAEERLQLLTRATNDVIWDWDLQHNVLWWNENLHTQFGYLPEEIEPGIESWTRRIHPEDREAVVASIYQVIDSGEDKWTRQYHFLHGDGRVLQVVDRGFVLRDDSGQAVRMLGSILDVTQQRELEERVHQAQKMEAVGQLTGGVAHDFNNLLTVLIGNAEILSEQLPPKDSLRPLADMTLSAAKRGAELTNRLLAFARRQALQPRVLHLGEQIADMEGLLRRTLSEAIEIEQVSSEGQWRAEVDPGQLEVALLNLVINARDAMPEGGRLTIETGNAWLDDDYADRDPEITPGAYVRVSVSDTGSGMPRSVAERAFEPFFTTKPMGQGSGLGLSMVFGFVKQSGGHVRIYTEPGEGTSVKLYFPRSSGASKEEVARENRVGLRGQEHILVVEDDELVRDHLISQLQSLGYHVTSAEDGVSALTLLRGHGDIDLLLTDIIMPGGMNGRELADQALALRPGLRVLYTSGYTEDAIVHQGRVDTGVALLGKPYRRQELADKVREVLDATR